MGLSIPFDIKNTLFPTSFFVILQFALKFELFSLTFCDSMISHPLPHFKTRFSQKEKKVGRYDNIALNQRKLSVHLKAKFSFGFSG